MAGKGEIDAVVTAPVSKELIVKSGISGFVDQTTYFAGRFGVKNYNMLFYSGTMKVLLVTIHIPVSEVSSSLTAERMAIAIENSVRFCLSEYGDKRFFRIAVCGLNPHAGEGGLIGNEDKDIIQPAVNHYLNMGYNIEGPLPADTVFDKAENGYYQLVIAAYHDQGLAPFKLLHFNDGVNVTLGLPFIRTSPDHGTAFDLAGKGKADYGSMLSAIRLAIKLSGRQ